MDTSRSGLSGEETGLQGDPQRLTCSVSEAGQLLGIGRNRAYQSVKDGTIPSVRFGRLVRVPLAALQRMLDGVGVSTQ